MELIYFGIWIAGMKAFDLLPVTSAKVVGGLMVVHFIFHMLRECNVIGTTNQGGPSDINRPLNLNRQGHWLDDDDWSDEYYRLMEDERMEEAKANLEYWVWENPHLEELEREGLD